MSLVMKRVLYLPQSYALLARKTSVAASTNVRCFSSSGLPETFKQRVREGPGLEDFLSVKDPKELGEEDTIVDMHGNFKPSAVKRRERAVPGKFVRKEEERLPEWLKVPLPAGKDFKRIQKSVTGTGLATVCEEAKCPNIGECWGGHGGIATATIMVLGDTCTRGCRFCAVKTARNPAPPNPLEPENVANTISQWGVDYVVITSVDRDDLPDGGSQHYGECVRRLKQKAPHIHVECLTGDFAGDLEQVGVVVNSGVDVFAHNIETVERTTPDVRDYRATYRQSLAVLAHAKSLRPDMPTKSSIMLGCGETDEEVEQALKDLRSVGVDIVTLGQYLRPSRRHMPVARYVPPAEFDMWRDKGMAMGFAYVASGPLVRSSYKAGEVFIKSLLPLRGTPPVNTQHSEAK